MEDHEAKVAVGEETT
jgi:hypothetical protein